MPGSVYEEIYYRLPVPVQNGIFSLYGLSLARKRYNKFFHEHLHKLKRTEWWPPEEIEAYQDAKVRHVVKHAYETVPFYRRWYDEHGVDVGSVNGVKDLDGLPVLTKSLVRENQAEMVSTSFKKSTLVKTLTSGTTGTPLAIYQTKEGLALQWAIWWRHKARFGLTVEDRHLTFGSESTYPT